MAGTFGFRVGDTRQGAVQVQGLSKVQRDLRKLAEGLNIDKTEFLAENKAVAEIVIGDAKRFVPVLSGALAESVRNASTKKAAKIRAGYGTRVEYAGPIHFGWPSRRIKPQPFIYDAIDQRRDEVRQRYDALVSRLIDKYDLG